MANYYFLGTLLPDLHLEEPPKIDFREFKSLLKDNLTSSDFRMITTLGHFFDILNLRMYWKNEPLNRFGTLDPGDYEEALATRSRLPEYVFNYIEKYSSKEEWIYHFPGLLATYFREEIKESKGILKQYFSLERKLRLVGVAFRAKKMGIDVIKELQYEDPEEELIAQILAQKDAPTYTPPEEFAELKNIFDQYGDHPIELQKALIIYRFKKIDEWLGLELFSIDRIIGYAIELIMIISWQEMDKEKGLKIVDRILKETS